jgi:hypothetical protein
VLISNVRFFILCTTGPSCYDFHTHRHASGGWSGLYTSEQRNFLVNYRYERHFPFPSHRVPTVHYTHLYGFIKRCVTCVDPPSAHLLSPHLRRNPLVGFCRHCLQQPPADTSIRCRNQRYETTSRLQRISQSAAEFLA